jgi:hypothetical protein
LAAELPLLQSPLLPLSLLLLLALLYLQPSLPSRRAPCSSGSRRLAAGRRVDPVAISHQGVVAD